MNKITLLRNLINNQDGRFFTVVFTKKDGSTRKMTARRGVKKYLKGGVNKVELNHPEYMTVFDMAKLDYRTVNLNTVQEIHADKATFFVV
jgi:hypothetical protein